MTANQDFFFTIAHDGYLETMIKKSRFICHLKRIADQEEAREFIARVKKKHYKARHNCSAFIVKEDGHVLERSSDDGEPSGTAGIPMLEALKNKELTNVCAVITRYFGGVKLGAGGLIRAYAGSVSSTIQELGVIKNVLQRKIELTIDYSQNDLLQHFFKENPEFVQKDPVFAEQVSMIIFVDEEKVADFQKQVLALLNGKVSFSLKEKAYRDFG